MFFIQGFFCQTYAGLGTAYMPGEGLTAVVREGPVSVKFAGLIYNRDYDPRNELVGDMSDPLGESKLSDITITEDRIEFTKTYLQQQGDKARPALDYTFRRSDDNTWVGEYIVAIPSRPTGPARCIITPYNPKLFREDLEKFAAQSTPESPEPSSGKEEAELPF